MKRFDRRLHALPIAASAAIILAAILPTSALAAEPTSAREIVRIQAKSMVTSGQTPGIAVAVIENGAEPLFFSYGAGAVRTDGAPPKPFRADMLFEIGSNTKLFTTNLLGQRIAAGTLELDTPLSDFSAQIGELTPKMGRVTLKELGDFTGGVANAAPICDPLATLKTPGCMPSPRPTIQQYGPQDMAAYFRSVTPYNFSTDPPIPAKRLPAPYLYSNFSVGMLGLLIGGAPGEPLGNKAVRGWYGKVQDEILMPLGMQNTYLRVPAGKEGRKISGYNLATAVAGVDDDGAVANVTMVTNGGFYDAPPQVKILGGGGSGASASATLADGGVEQIGITNGGQGYTARARITFSDGGSTIPAEGQAVVANGKIVGVRLRQGGANYKAVPQVTITGGRTADGRDATATARLVNGSVSYVSIVDPGAGYVDPLTVVIAPGRPTSNAIPAWAPAGALSSTLEDMAKFARAATRRPGTEAPDLLLEGFRIAQKAYACQGVDNPPSLKQCPAGALRSGLAWMAAPRDSVNRVPPVYSKIGALPGYWSAVAVMPRRGLGVVVFMNSWPGEAELADVEDSVERVAENILYALFYERCGGALPASRKSPCGDGAD